MANQLKMADAQAILALVGRGWSYRRIARELDVDRATVRRYVRLAAGDGSKPAMALTGSGGHAQPNPAMALAGSSQPADSRLHLSAAWPWREVILQKLGAGLCAQRIYQDLQAPEHGYAGSYHSVRRLIQKLAAAHDPPVRRWNVLADQDGQVVRR